MADTLAHVAQDAAASGLDPIQLHAQAMNSLSRIMRELRANSTDYEAVSRHLVRATDALETLRTVEASYTH